MSKSQLIEPLGCHIFDESAALSRLLKRAAYKMTISVKMFSNVIIYFRV